MNALQGFIRLHERHGVTMNAHKVSCPLCGCQATINAGALSYFDDALQDQRFFMTDESLEGTPLDTQVSIRSLRQFDNLPLCPDDLFPTPEDWEVVVNIETQKAVCLRRRPSDARLDASLQEQMTEIRKEFLMMPFLGGAGVDFEVIEETTVYQELVFYRRWLMVLRQRLQEFWARNQEELSDYAALKRDLHGFAAILRRVTKE